MFILHSVLEQGNLLLWAEKSFQKLSVRRGRKPINAPPRAHPFAATQEELLSLLTSLAVQKTQCTKGLLWLPSSNEGPDPSHPILEGPVERSQTLAPWAVDGCCLTPQQVLLWLAKSENSFGKEHLYLQEVLRFTASLAMRQRYLPSLQYKDEQWLGTWVPVFMGQDKMRLCHAASAMPSLCRSWSSSLKHETLPDSHPEQVLEYFMQELLQELLRQSALLSHEKIVKTSNSHDAWMQSLTTGCALYKTQSEEAVSLQSTIQEWQSPLQNTLSSPFRFCLKIHEPEATISINEHLLSTDNPWKISYLLQAYDDPSLLVTTEDVWNPKGTKRKVLERPNFQARQFVLNSLGMATSLCDKIEESLQTSIPTGFSLQPDEVLSFFAQDALRLEEAGFGVIGPNWWKKNGTRLAAKAHIDSPALQANPKGSLWDDICMGWHIFLGNLCISQEELEQLAQLKESLVKLRGEWIFLRQEDLQRALELLQKPPSPPSNALDLLHIASDAETQTVGLPMLEVTATGWVHTFLSSLQDHSVMQSLELPKGFVGSLRPYQLRGYSWMTFLQQWQLGACLADDMGLGKTPQTLAMIVRKWEMITDPKPTLIVCPTSLTGNWQKEASKFTPSLPVYVHHGIERKKGDSFLESIQGYGLVITSYSLLHRDAEFFDKIRWEGIILDEAQNIKNADTKQTRAAYALQSNYRLALTGTPVENHVGDLWSLMHFLNPGYLGSQEMFRKTFFNPIQIEKRIESMDLLKKLTKPLILRRVKTDRTIITDLPDKVENKMYCSLSSEQITLYETIIKEANAALAIASGIARKGIILATLMKLKQVCNHPSHFLNDGPLIAERSGKLERFCEMVEEIDATQDRVLVFTQYAEMGHLLKHFLENKRHKEVLFLHGGSSKSQRDSMVERFQTEDNGPNVFLLSLRAGGVGLNLTRAAHVFHFDRWWNPAIENQATDRAFRIGQKQNVYVHKFICLGTIEERIDAMIEQKKEVASNIVGTGEGWITELSTESLQDLWKLQKTKL